MNRVNLLLIMAVVASGLILVKTAYDARRLFTELDRAEREERHLAADYRRLDAERQTQATHLRVEKVARERLHMRNASAAVTQYVDDVATPLGASVAASGAAR